MVTMNFTKFPCSGPFIFLALLAGIVFVPCFSTEQDHTRGDLIGFIFEGDGTTPLGGTELVMKKIPEGKVYTSSPTDKKGRFRIQDVEKGIYRWGVKTPGGKVNGKQLLGIRARTGEVAKIYIAVTSPEREAGNVSGGSFFPDSIGQASILAGNPAVVYEIAVIDDEPREAGPFQIK